MSAGYDPIQYKVNSIQNWNTVARGYHDDWAGKCRGPFRSTVEIVRVADIAQSDSVLDLACGTGAVSMQVAQLLGSSGMLVGIDFSRGALEIARSSVPIGNFFEMDAENIGLVMKFDKILCQYALMFFPDPTRVLRRLYELLKPSGKLAVAVHGSSERVPYFSTVMQPVLRNIPNIRPEGTPTVHRFGNPADLQAIMHSVGFSDVSIQDFTFNYQAGTFEEYWSDYMATTANSIRATIESKGPDLMLKIKSEAEMNAQQFSEGGVIRFPWNVLIATAVRAQD